MERNMKTPLLLLLLIILIQALIVRSNKCPSLPINNLTCYNDFSQNITCEWDSPYLSHHTDTRCKINAERTYPPGRTRSFTYASCDLEPVDISNPARQKCSLIFARTSNFKSFCVWSITVTCKDVEQSVNIEYKPACHIKVNPPGKPNINNTTVSWLPYITKHSDLTQYKSELQWKQQAQSWSDSSVQKKETSCENECMAELDPDFLIQGEMYEARVRVQVEDKGYEGPWSDWSLTASWSSPVGQQKPPSGFAVGIVQMIVAGVALFALMLAVILYKSNKTTWVYMVKRIRGPPLPNPAESFLQDSWLTPHFTSDSFHSFLKPVEIVSVEVTSSVDFVTPCKPVKKMPQNKNSSESTSSSFSNPSYSELCTPPPPPVHLLTPGNLEPCAADSPYGPVGSQSEERNTGNTEQEDNKVTERDIKFLKLLSKGGSSSSNNESMTVILDYEKTDQVQAERLRLQSLDSGMHSCEEVSQESIEVDSINVSDSHEEELEDEEQKKEEDVQKVAFEKLFGIKGGVLGKEPILVCSDYERVQNLQADSPELSSLDSGVSSGDEEHVSQEELTEDADKPTETTRFLFPPPPSIALPCSLLPLPQLPLNFSALASSPALRPPLSHVLDRIARMSSGNVVEPSGDGYLPVRQEQC